MNGRQWIQFFLVVSILCLALLVLTPRQWEPGNENWIRWAAARVFHETGELPRFSTGPLYVFFLQFFSFFHYPFSQTIEYIVTHLFLYLALYTLLQGFMLRRYALLLTLAWIPHLATVEPGNNLFGIAFICLYFLPGKSVFRNEGYFPPALLAAALSHPVYGTFLLGHVVGTFVEHRSSLRSDQQKQQQKILLMESKIPLTKYFAKLLSFALLLFFFLVITASPSRPEYNHILMDPTYSPVALESPTDAFFQNGAERYVRRMYPQEEWIYHDWYLSVPEAYGNATTILGAVIKKPETVFRNFLTNMGTGIQLPGFFFSGAFLGPLGIVFFLFFFFGGVGAVLRLKKEKNYSLLFSLLLGTSSAFLVLALTTFNAARYVVTLLPVALLLLLHAPNGFAAAAKYWFEKKAKKKEAKFPTPQGRTNKKIILSGIFFVIVGLLLNGKVVNKLIFPNRILPASLLQQIFFIDTFLIALGIALLFFHEQIILFLEKIMGDSKITRKDRGIKYLVFLSVLLLILTAQYPAGRGEQLKLVMAGEDFLSGQKPISMVNAYPELSKYLQKDTRVLAREYTWIMAFTDVRLENVYQIWSIPPFNSSTQQTQEKLKNLDTILVSYWLASDKPGLGMQTYPRYFFHIKPFLEKATVQGWAEKKVNGYGRVFTEEHK